MDIFEIIRKRHSYRGAYKPDPIPREHLKMILQAGLDAPSGCNKQTTALIAVDDPELLQKIREATERPAGEPAPAAICVLTRRIIAYRDRCYSVQDYSAAIENMLLATVALGYETCWYEGRMTDLDRAGHRIAQVLGVPEEYELVCYLPIGIPESEPVPPRKQPFEERAWFNGFGGKDAD